MFDSLDRQGFLAVINTTYDKLHIAGKDYAQDTKRNQSRKNSLESVDSTRKTGICYLTDHLVFNVTCRYKNY